MTGRKLGAELQRLMMDKWPQLEAMRLMYDRAIGKLGKKSRVADQFGTMLACAHLALGTDPDEQEWIDKFVGGLELGAFLDRDEAEGESQGVRVAASHLRARCVGGGHPQDAVAGAVGRHQREGGAHRTRARAPGGAGYGLRVEKELYTVKQAEALGLSSMPPVDRGSWWRMRMTGWAVSSTGRAGRWRVEPGAAARAGCATNPGRGVKMGGLVRKGIWLPLATLLDGSAWGSGAPDDAPEPPDVTGDDGAGYAAGYGEEGGGSNGSGTT